MKNLNLSNNRKVRVEEIEISEVTQKLYEYSKRDHEITALAESISDIGQKQPVQLLSIKGYPKYVLADGVLVSGKLQCTKNGK